MGFLEYINEDKENEIIKMQKTLSKIKINAEKLADKKYNLEDKIDKILTKLEKLKMDSLEFGDTEIDANDSASSILGDFMA